MPDYKVGDSFPLEPPETLSPSIQITERESELVSSPEWTLGSLLGLAIIMLTLYFGSGALVSFIKERQFHERPTNHSTLSFDDHD